MVKLITVICLVPRSGSGVVRDKGDEWEITPRRAARLIASGQVKLKDPGDAVKLPEVDPPEQPTPVPAAAAQVTEPEDAPSTPPSGDEFDESDALPDTPQEPEPKETGLQRAKAKRGGKK